MYQRLVNCKGCKRKLNIRYEFANEFINRICICGRVHTHLVTEKDIKEKFKII